MEITRWSNRSLSALNFAMYSSSVSFSAALILRRMESNSFLDLKYSSFSFVNTFLKVCFRLLISELSSFVSESEKSCNAVKVIGNSGTSE